MYLFIGSVLYRLSNNDFLSVTFASLHTSLYSDTPQAFIGAPELMNMEEEWGRNLLRPLFFSLQQVFNTFPFSRNFSPCTPFFLYLSLSSSRFLIFILPPARALQSMVVVKVMHLILVSSYFQVSIVLVLSGDGREVFRHLH